MEKNNDKERKISFGYNLREYFSFLKNYKLLLFLALFCVLILEGRHVLEKYLFKIVIDRGTEFESGQLASSGFMHILGVVALVFGGIILTGFVFRWLFIHFVNRLDGNLISDMKRKYFNHLVGLDHSFHVSHKTGSLISRLGRGSRAMEKMSDVIVFNLAPLLFQLTILIISLLYLDKISALVIFLTIFVFIAYSWFLQRAQQNANLEANKAEDIEKANVGDIFTNIDSIKYFGKEHTIKSKFAGLVNNTRLAQLRHWDYFRWFDSGQSVILGLGTFFLVFFPMKAFLAGQISLGTVTFIYTAYAGLMGPLFSFIHGMREFYRSMADFEDLFEYGKIQSKLKDKGNAGNLKIEKGKVDFDDITFSYGNRKIFSGFNLNIQKNEKIALVGHSGCGKTTLIKLLYRLYDIDSGSVKIDGKDIREFKQESVRNEMAIVPQECVLFDDTIYNNIAFSRPDATKAEVFSALKFAQLDKIIKNFPNKENTIVGERGVKLSGGEKQRVSIARAILADKKILVLDEATSSLDSETEFEIQKDLEKLMQGRTSIIIAHRLSTIMKADRIIVMKAGKIVQQGSHKQLINQDGEYKKLWLLQKGGYLKD